MEKQAIKGRLLKDSEGIYRVIPSVCDDCSRAQPHKKYCMNGLTPKKFSCVWKNVIRPRSVDPYDYAS